MTSIPKRQISTSLKTMLREQNFKPIRNTTGSKGSYYFLSQLENDRTLTIEVALFTDDRFISFVPFIQAWLNFEVLDDFLSKHVTIFYNPDNDPLIVKQQYAMKIKSPRDKRLDELPLNSEENLDKALSYLTEHVTEFIFMWTERLSDLPALYTKLENQKLQNDNPHWLRFGMGVQYTRLYLKARYRMPDFYKHSEDLLAFWERHFAENNNPTGHAKAKKELSGVMKELIPIYESGEPPKEKNPDFIPGPAVSPPIDREKHLARMKEDEEYCAQMKEKVSRYNLFWEQSAAQDD